MSLNEERARCQNRRALLFSVHPSLWKEVAGHRHGIRRGYEVKNIYGSVMSRSRLGIRPEMCVEMLTDFSRIAMRGASSAQKKGFLALEQRIWAAFRETGIIMHSWVSIVVAQVLHCESLANGIHGSCL